MTSLLQDVRYGWRVLRKSPGFTALAVLVLALGIGANTAIFSVVNAVLIRPLPFKDPARLVIIWHVPPPKSFPGMTEFAVSAANYLDWKRQNHVFDGMAIYTGQSFDLTGGDKPESVPAATVEPTFFSVLGSPPLLGRTFVDGEDQSGRDNVVVLSYGFWQTRFGGDPAVVGKQITLNNQPRTVIGVMGPKFSRPDFAKIWVPLAWTAQERAVRGEHHYMVVARLKPGVTVEQSQSEMSSISSQLSQQYPDDDKDWGAVVVPLREELVGDVRPSLLILLGAVAFVLLIACANVANLVLAKTLARRKEIAIRTALGASRRRVLQQVLSETLLLSLAGGALGLAVAHFGVTLIVKFLGDQLPKSADVYPDVWVLAFTLGISVFAGLVAGLLPALRLTKADVSDALKQGLGRTASDSGGNRTRSVLVVCEVALSLMLLVGAGLLIRSLWMLRQIDPGFDPRRVVTMGISIPGNKFPTPEQQVNYFNRLLERVRAVPAVEAVGVVDDLPLDGGGSHQPVAIEGRPVVPMAEQPEVDVRLISPGYLSAMRIPVVRGRDFNDGDAPGRTATILISQSMAKVFWPHEDPIGKHVTLTFAPEASREVIGIVGDVKLDSLNETRQTTTLYVPMAQLTVPSTGGWHSFGMSLVVRTPSMSVVPSVVSAVHDVDSAVPVQHVQSMDELISDSLSPQRFTMLLLAAFAGLALLLAAVGIYSVLAYAVRRRLREIGIRMALGAQLNDVVRMVVLEGMKPTLVGVLIGLAGALALGRVLSSVIYGVSSRDLATFFTVSLLLTVVGFCASIIPAYRATRVDPMKTLREE